MTVKPVVRQHASILATLDLIPALAAIVTVTVLSIFTAPFRGKRDAPTIYLHVAYTALRKATARLTPLQLQIVSPLTDVIYGRYVRAAKIRPETVELGGGAKGHWIGNKNAKTVLIWYHGGGFCLPANIGYFKFFADLVSSSRSAGKDLAIFALTYTLAPHASYPTQHIQASSALDYILTKTGRKPSDVLLGGDSAGGNLAIGVLSHLAHPHPDISAIKLSEPLAGVICLSPWTIVADDHTELGVEIYDGGDLVPSCVNDIWGSAFLGGAAKDNYTNASLADADWFKSFPVKHVLVCAGGNEIMLPAVDELVKTMKAALPSVDYFVGDREAHVAPVYNLYVMDKTETTQGNKVKQWLRDVL